MTRDDVLAAYRDEGCEFIDLDAMADEIVQLRDDLRELVNSAQWAETVASAELEHLRRVLTVLREPSEAVLQAALTTMFYDFNGPDEVAQAMRAAVAAAEQEVQGAS